MRWLRSVANKFADRWKQTIWPMPDGRLPTSSGIWLSWTSLSRRTLETHAEKFLETLSGAESTLASIKHSIARLLSDWPEGSPRLLTKIKKADCERWLAKYGDRSASTVNNHISMGFEEIIRDLAGEQSRKNQNGDSLGTRNPLGSQTNRPPECPFQPHP